MKKPLTVWFSNDGKLVCQVSSWILQHNNSNNYTPEEAKDFVDTLVYVEIQDYSRGSARVFFKSINSGRIYSMFVRDFHNVINNRLFVDNQIHGTFHFMKKGEAQSIKLVIDNKKEI